MPSLPPVLAPMVIAPGAGTVVEAGLLPVTIKAAPEETGGWLLVEQEILPGTMVPAHRHDEAAQWSYVTEGALHVMADGDVHVVEAGGWFLRPPGAWHAVWNPSRTQTARHVEGTLPGKDVLALFLTMEDLKRGGQLTPGALAQAAMPLRTVYDTAATARIEREYGVSAGRGWSL